MTCCLNPACHNPPNPDGTKFCLNCGTGLVVLRNRYRPIKSLGSGGFGKTYLAQDIDKLNQKCVIKQFAPQIQGTSALQKATELFEQEARRLEQLGEHPQIPTLLAYFQEDGRLYLVQQFIDGQTLLAELEQQGNFSENKIRELLADLLEILKVVHQQKVIHRDIKPENIIRRGSNAYNKGEAERKLVLIDFGASKQMTKTVISQQGTSIGSFGYVPMEQIKGGEAYRASDLYSLGATCFHLLSGIHPWDLWQTQAYGWVVNWRSHLQQPVSSELGQILDKLLQQDYKERYQSVEEVLLDLNSSSPPLTPQPVIKPTQITQPHISDNQKKSLPKYLLIPLIIISIGAGAFYLQGLRENPELYNRQGIEKYEKEDLRGAIEDYSQAIKIDQKSAQAYYNRGETRGDLGDNQNAIEDLRQATDLFAAQGNHADAKRSQGLLNYLSQDYQAAIAAYTEAIRLNPNDYKAYNNRGLAYYISRNPQAAIEDFSQAIKINPNFALAYNYRGVTRDYLGDKQAAITDYNQAIKINPYFAYAYVNRGSVHNYLGDKQAAIADYDQAIKINPNFAQAYNYRGIVHSALKEKSAAIADYNQAIKIDPIYALDYYNRGDAQYNLGDKQAAISDYNQAIKINSNYADAYLARGLAHNDLGDKQAASADYNQAIKINPSYADAYLSRGVVRNELGDQQAAISDYNQAIKINPNYADAYYNRGLARYALGDRQAAIADYNQAIKINPNYAEAYNYRGNAHRDLGDQQAAIADYNQAIKVNPDYAEAYNYRGLLRSSLGDKQAAITDYNQAIKINSNFAEPYNNRGLAHSDLGDQQAAIVDYNEAIKINSNLAVSYYNRGYARSALRDTQAAIADYRIAAQLYKQQGKESDYQDALNQIKRLDK